MRFASLGSGSKGNATVVKYADTLVLIDCGFSVKETEKRLMRLGLEASDLYSILVTHEHSDHLKGIPSLAKKYQCPVYMTAGTRQSLNDCSSIDLRIIDSHSCFHVNDLELTPVPVAHDAREPVQFVLRGGELTLGILTDLGSVTPHVLDSYGSCDGLLVEFNHDVDMLASGPYPEMLKRRVGGEWGHLSNQQALHLLNNIAAERLQRLIIGHISQKNNSLELVKTAVAALQEKVSTVIYAEQNEGFPWQELRP
jgi:phosphoribosyl 1,2-cyclic phosphodiesterase